MGIMISDKQIQDRLADHQEAVLQRKREGVPEAAKDAGLDAARGRVRHQGPADLAEAVQQGDGGREGLGRRRQKYYNAHSRSTSSPRAAPSGTSSSRCAARTARRAAKCLPDAKAKAQGRPAVRPDQGRRELRRAREEELAGSGLGGSGRKAHDRKGQTVAPFEQTAFLLGAGNALAAGQDAVRLAPDHADLEGHGERTRLRSSRWRSRSASSSSSRSRRRWRRGSTTMKKDFDISYAAGFTPALDLHDGDDERTTQPATTQLPPRPARRWRSPRRCSISRS